ncbi:porin family protein [Flavobacterium humi]|uniref:PorT family protein n=1 Tax=Flavobacterium humi TaxID=2562683 RepID=A0A4Z0L5D5_9FLAO|nr:porin family protein [Flavobacterium humi]TGD56782.1 PorT family protein [Flavobacterium humi]
MKKVLLTAAALFLFGFANAQETKFGVKAGLNLANLTGDLDDTSMKASFHVGGFAEIKISDKFAVQPEVLYSVQGADVDGGTYEFSYINVPIMAKFFPIPQLSLEAGPQVGFLTSAKGKPDDGPDIDVKDFLKSTDFGINLGAGYNFTDHFSAGLRYNFGLSNISDEDGGDIKNSVLSLSVGYSF